MTPLRIGVVGAGSIATTAHIPVLRAMPGGGIAWIADRHEDRARRAAAHNNVPFASLRGGQEALPPCDVMLLALPLPPRTAYFDYCASTGISVFAEKPLANDATQHAALTGAFEPFALSVGYQRRCYGTSGLLRSLIESRVFGHLVGIRMSEGGRIVRTGGAGNYQDAATAEGGGIVKNLGCHSLDLAIWLTSATRCVVRECQVEWDGHTDRRAHARIALTRGNEQGGDICELDWTVSGLDFQTNDYQFEFENAVVRCSVAPADYAEVSDRRGRVLSRLAVPAGAATTSAQAFYLQWRDVIAGVRERRASVVSGLSSLMTALLIDEIVGR